jgi:hypothetical protein
LADVKKYNEGDIIEAYEIKKVKRKLEDSWEQKNRTNAPKE